MLACCSMTMLMILLKCLFLAFPNAVSQINEITRCWYKQSYNVFGKTKALLPYPSHPCPYPHVSCSPSSLPKAFLPSKSKVLVFQVHLPLLPFLKSLQLGTPPSFPLSFFPCFYIFSFPFYYIDSHGFDYHFCIHDFKKIL